jgi:IS1 family transposase
VNEPIVGTLAPQDVNVVIQPVNEAEMDELWSVVGDKGHQRWLWHAMDHHSGTLLADVLGTHTDTVFVTLKQLFAPCGMTHFSTDEWGTYQRNLRPQHHTIGKEHPQKQLWFLSSETFGNRNMREGQGLHRVGRTTYDRAACPPLVKPSGPRPQGASRSLRAPALLGRAGARRAIRHRLLRRSQLALCLASS